MSNKILVVDDETEIADLIEVYLKNENYTVFKFYTAQEALNCIETTPIDLAILDIMLPDIDGFTLCKKIREHHTYPIIMLTAKDAETDKITGLTLGADDYITKPFRPLEMIARVKSQLRRYQKYNPAHSDTGATSSAASEDNLVCGSLTMNIKAHIVLSVLSTNSNLVPYLRQQESRNGVDERSIRFSAMKNIAVVRLQPQFS